MLILASTSPRRRELLALVTPNYIIKEPLVDEKEVPQTGSVEKLVEKLSYLKAESLLKYNTEDTILGCDTIVVIDGEILGKPTDREDAKRMLKLLSGKTHRVISAFTLLSKDSCITKSVETLVKFHTLSSSLIEEYVATESPLDKAGAYGIQDRTFKLVEYIEGSFSNVMGLPIEELTKYLLEF